jgi:hypothetical protein
MSRNFFKTIASRAVEIAGAILLALFCFMGFLLILKLLFPSGTPLSELLKGAEPRQAAPARDYLPGEQQTEPFVANLSWYNNSVKAKSSGDIAWTDARKGMSLYNRDAVQTAKQSSAVISFDAANSLEMTSNSLVIVKSLTKDTSRNERKSVLLVIDGELRGRLSGSAKDAVQVEMALPAGVARVQSQKSADGKADFTVRVNPDKSSTVTVHHGIAEVTAQGKTVRVGANLSTTVSLTGPPTTPKGLMAAPATVSPVAGASYAYRELPPKIRFSWQGPAGAKNFRLQLASDPEFKKMVIDEKVGEAGYSHGNLKQGEYFWKVSSLDGWTEGKNSPIRSFRLVQDREPPQLQVEFPPPLLEDRQYLLKGTTEAGAELFINNKPVSTGAKGEFAQQLQLQRGINVIIVEAVDAAGNITYKTHKVISKY